MASQEIQSVKNYWDGMANVKERPTIETMRLNDHYWAGLTGEPRRCRLYRSCHRQYSRALGRAQRCSVGPHSNLLPRRRLHDGITILA